MFYPIRGHNILGTYHSYQKREVHVPNSAGCVKWKEVFTQATAACEAAYGIQDLKPELPRPEGWQ